MDIKQLLKKLLIAAILYTFVLTITYIAICVITNTTHIVLWSANQRLLIGTLPIFVVVYYALLNIKQK